ncbi:MAG: putative methylase [Thermoproteota archaeon]|nr:putative methylase [Thermoproteota archaeon]
MVLVKSDMVETRIKLKHLEICLSKLAPHPKPKLGLEEYTLDSESAAKMLHIAGDIYDDIKKKSIIDLGCGTGILGIGATLLGAEYVVGVDLDGENIRTATENTRKMQVEVEYVVGDIEVIRGFFNTTLTNPPFGSWRRGTDVLFLRKALKVSDTVYSLHKAGESNRRFLIKKIESLGGKVDSISELKIIIPHTFDFHRKEKYFVNAEMYRTISNRKHRIND